jgi:aspartate aminotransferase
MGNIPPSGTLKVFEIASKLEAEGKKIYHFEVGQPDFPTPQNIVKAGIDALNDGHTKYASSRGAPPLLDALEDFYERKGISIDGRKNLVVTPGAKMALFQGFLSAIDIGDDVLVLSPAWPTYRVMIRTAGAKPVDIPTSVVYELDDEALKTAATKSVSALVINSPNNPTGGVLAKDQMKLIYDLAIDHDFAIFSDEIYEALVYDGFKQTSMLEIDPTMEQTIVISGFSKTYSMTGWRLGYAVGNEEAIGNMIRIQQNTTSCAPSFVQIAGVEALNGDQSSINKMIDSYAERRSKMVAGFREMPGVTCEVPKGAFYCFPDFSEYGLSSNTLAELLLIKTGVATAPGNVFGTMWDNNLRFSYASSLSVIEEGLAAVRAFLSTLD